jgi:hypothetical protein
MAQGFVSFDLTELSKVSGVNLQFIQRTATRMLYKELIRTNPVATGFSHSNWNVSLGEPDLSVKGKRDPHGSYAPDAEPKIPENPNNEDMFVSNGVEYIQYLEEGTSSQAPDGFIQHAIDYVEGQWQTIYDEVTETHRGKDLA